MEVILRRRRSIHNEAGIDVDETEMQMSGATKSALASVLAVALAGGVTLSSYELGRLAEQMKEHGTVDIAASASAKSPIRRLYDFNALSVRSSILAEDIRAAEQTSFAWKEVEGQDILDLVNEHGGAAVVERDTEGIISSISACFATEYDAHEMGEVLDSLHAAGVTPKKIVGDLAQAAIAGANGLEQVICLAEWTISWKRKTVEATTTDDALYESSLGSSKSWTVKSKFMFVDGDQSQVDGVLVAIDTNALDAIPWTFFPTVETGRQAFQGLCIIDGIDIGSGTGKIVGLDASLKGTGPLKRLVQVAPVQTTTVSGVAGQV